MHGLEGEGETNTIVGLLPYLPEEGSLTHELEACLPCLPAAWCGAGYTAKVAGTEVGVTEPEATFSACFGSAFLMWHPTK